MNSKIKLTFFLLGVFLIAGCSSNDEATTSTSEVFAGGTEALTLEFFPQSPPSVVYPNSEFGIILDVNNVGEYTLESRDRGCCNEDGETSRDIAPATILFEIVGFPSIFKKGDDANDLESLSLIEYNNDTFEGTEKDVDGNIIEGGQAQITFDNVDIRYDDCGKEDSDERKTNNCMSSLRNEFIFPITATACTRYQTTSVSNYCILNDFTQASGDALCSISGDRNVENSGAPLHVTAVNQRVSGRESLSFIITFEQVGQGKISLSEPQNINSNSGKIRTSRWNTEDACNNSPQDFRIDRFLASFDFSIDTSDKDYTASRNSYPLTCNGFEPSTTEEEIEVKNAGIVTLRNGKAQILCHLNFDLDEDEKRGYRFEKVDATRQLTITSDYDYLVEEKTNITVRPLLR